MIFAIAGSQLAFPRLMQSLDAIATRTGVPVIAQTADPTALFATIHAEAFMAPETFERHMAAATMIVAHAGIGTIIGAAQHRKPLVLMPRRHALGEHRNDHQMATADRFRDTSGIIVVEDEQALEAAVLRPTPPPVGGAIGPGRATLIAAVAAALR